MLTIEQIRAALRDRKVPIVADATKLSRQTIYTLLRDDQAKPTPATLKLLSDYLARPL